MSLAEQPVAKLFVPLGGTDARLQASAPRRTLPRVRHSEASKVSKSWFSERRDGRTQHHLRKGVQGGLSVRSRGLLNEQEAVRCHQLLADDKVEGHQKLQGEWGCIGRAQELSACHDNAGAVRIRCDASVQGHRQAITDLSILAEEVTSVLGRVFEQQEAQIGLYNKRSTPKRRQGRR